MEIKSNYDIDKKICTYNILWTLNILIQINFLKKKLLLKIYLSIFIKKIELYSNYNK